MSEQILQQKIAKPERYFHEKSQDELCSYVSKKRTLSYNGTKVDFTKRQIAIMGFVARGYSNIKIAKELGVTESSIKLFVYRLMRKLEKRLSETVDRFYLIIIAQRIGLIKSDDYR